MRTSRPAAAECSSATPTGRPQGRLPTTGLTSDHDPSAFGQSVSFTATVTATSPGAGTPTGTVTFMDGSSPIGTGTLAAAWRPSRPPPWPSQPLDHRRYGGDKTSTATPRSPATQPGRQPGQHEHCPYPSEPLGFGQPVTSPPPSPPTPRGRHADRHRHLHGRQHPDRHRDLMDGVATFTISTLSVAPTRSPRATTGTEAHREHRILTPVPIVTPPNRPDRSRTPTLPSSASGHIHRDRHANPPAVHPDRHRHLHGRSHPIGTGTLQNGTATLTTSALTVGAHTITASYAGGTNFGGDTGSLTGNPEVIYVQPLENTSLSERPEPEPVRVRPIGDVHRRRSPPIHPDRPTPTGTVTFHDGATTLARAPADGNVGPDRSRPGGTANSHDHRRLRRRH